MDILCQCGCGYPVPNPSRSSLWRLRTGRVTGLFLTGHRFRGENNPRWKGGRASTSSGYVLVRAPEHPNARKNGYVLEHRLVMSDVLGRPLDAGELVHHENAQKSDNRPGNLAVMARPEHTRTHNAGSASPRWIEQAPKVCRTCGKPFLPSLRGNYRRAVFCSLACRGARSGEEACNVKLTVEDVTAIRLSRGIVGQRELATRFGISKTQVGRIQRGESW